MSTQTSFDLTGLSRAIHGRDCHYHLALYADDAEVEILDGSHADAPLQVLRGKAAIGDWLDGMSSAAVHNQVRDAVVLPDRVTYTEECCYGDGSKVVLECRADVRRGQITRATVRLVHVPRHQSLPRLAEPGAATTLDLQGRGSVPRRVLPGQGKARHLPGNFLG